MVGISGAPPDAELILLMVIVLLESSIREVMALILQEVMYSFTQDDSVYCLVRS